MPLALFMVKRKFLDVDLWCFIWYVLFLFLLNFYFMF